VKVLFIARASLFDNRGGDTMQITNTAKYLKALNIETDIRLSNEVIDYSSYDLLHFFNVIRPADILFHARKSGKPYVVSTIYVDYSEFDRRQRRGLPGLLFRLLPANVVEFAKVIARAVINHEKIISPEYIWKGHRRSVKSVIKNAALLLPNSHNEYRRLIAGYKIHRPYKVIPNAIDPEIFGDACGPRENDLVLCVGRIEGIKNQLSLVKALTGTSFTVYIIGAPGTNHREYYQQCKSEAGSNIHFIENLPQTELAIYYRRAKTHVLPSWFETTGLSSLEAAAMGCNIVITDKGDTREYFDDMAFYCDPSSPQSIREAVQRAAASTTNNALQQKVLTSYTWAVTAKKTLEAYKQVLEK
jgi:glycosyltransferase involved in cell wall biosynthesis